ncbi:MAG: triose-phosphate isomerase [Gammaproteobacteria bacterium]|nr:triose-phosphate isomerase [Gammaproteobacteria bacterium]
MRQPFVAGNWKMNGSRESVEALLNGMKDAMGSISKTEVAVCPPFVYIPQVAQICAGTSIKWGSQDVSSEKAGAYTGETATSMLNDFDCTYAIVGHSERRTLHGESDEMVAKKSAAAQADGIIPIICIGETLEEREKGITEEVVGRQLNAVIDVIGVQALQKAVIAYEPVWAIGTGMTASPEQAQDVHAYIRKLIADKDAATAEKVQILYGGSVKADNAESLFGMPDIDGGLIGGASLKVEDFMAICRAGDNTAV